MGNALRRGLATPLSDPLTRCYRRGACRKPVVVGTGVEVTVVVVGTGVEVTVVVLGWRLRCQQPP